jgi:hypothetical protein
MATAFLPLANLFSALQDLMAWFTPRPAPVPCIAARAPVQRALAQPAPRQRAKPLRVVRVFEPSAPRAVAGRMVISGRMADVCAELDRLAALEARGC